MSYIRSGDYKAKLIDAIINPYISHSLLYLPNDKYPKLTFRFQILIQNLVRLCETDKDDNEKINLYEYIKEPPSREEFSSDEDYALALEYYNTLKRMLRSVSSDTLYVNPHELDQVIRLMNSFEDYLHLVSAIKGERLKIIITERSEYRTNDKRLFANILGQEKE